MMPRLYMMHWGRAAALGGMLAAMLFFTCLSFAAGRPTHLDKAKNPSGCAGCHKGHGKRGTPMLTAERNDICFSCHGISGSSRQGVLIRTDLSSAFTKRYKHPVAETSSYHVQGEELPEKSPAVPRHVACQDCHNVHMTEPGAAMKNAWGVKKGSARQREASEEYEVCYKCHSSSANLQQSKDVSLQFDPNNASFHPIEAPGRNKRLPSLYGQVNVSSLIKCTDCHGNDDPSGPKGPHGSNYEFMLKYQYITSETGEAPGVFALCYSCHSRQSILGNQSFQKHKEHVVYQHIPCAACHVAHGSSRNLHLIEFNTNFVASGQIASYAPAFDGRPVCYVKCHVGGRDIQHDPAFYSSKKWP